MAHWAAPLFLFHLFGFADAAFWHSGHNVANDLRVHHLESSAKVHEACIPDLPGGTAMAGTTMLASIALTLGVTVALIYYLSSKRSDALSLPGPAGPAAG